MDELYYDIHGKAYDPHGKVIVGSSAPRHVRAAYEKLLEVRLRHPDAYLKYYYDFSKNAHEILVEYYDKSTNSITGFSGHHYNGKSFNHIDFPEPSGVAAYTPVVGSLWSATHDFQDGDYGWAGVNTIMAISDVFLVKSIYKGISQGGLKAMTMGKAPWWSREGTSYRNFYGETGFIKNGQHGHHWFLHQKGPIGKYFPGFFKNQMWNVNPLWPKMHYNAGHG